MYIICMDMEGIITPEIWIEFAEKTGIPEFTRTTRDEPDYDVLMNYRMELLNKHGFGLKEIQDVIETMEPLPGAKAFLEELRSFSQVVVLSDTFTQFAMPLMEKLGYPTLMCNELTVFDESYGEKAGMISGYKLRTLEEGGTKLSAVRALQSTGYETIAIGDSFNDLAMLRASKAGILFRSTEEIIAANPDLPALETYRELMDTIKRIVY